jgi:hypothetical protein
MRLIMFSDFMQVLHIKRRHPTKNEYFPKHNLFTTIYILRKHKLNHKKYYNPEINMIKCIQATEHEVYMYAKFGCLDIYRFL